MKACHCVCVGGGSMKRNGFLDKAVSYLEEAGMEVKLFGIEPDPSVETVMRGAKSHAGIRTGLDRSHGWRFTDRCSKKRCGSNMNILTLHLKICAKYSDCLNFVPRHILSHLLPVPLREVTAFSIITDYEKGIKYQLQILRNHTGCCDR